MQKRIRQYFLGLCAVIVAIAASAVPIASIKGTYDILPESSRQFSPVQGAIWWETGLIKALFNFGHVVYATVDGTERIVGGDSAIMLTHHLFHVVQQSLNVSKNRSFPAYHLSTATIGSIAGTLAQFPKDVPDVEKLSQALMTTIEHDRDFASSIEETRRAREHLSIPLPDLQHQLQSQRNLVNAHREKWKIQKEPLKQTLIKQLKITKNEQKVLTQVFKQDNFAEIKTYAAKLEGSSKNQALDLLDALVNAKRSESSLQQSIDLIEKQIADNREDRAQSRLHDLVAALAEAYYDNSNWLPNTAESILVAFVYRKAESRADFERYLNAFGSLTGKRYVRESTTFVDDHYDDAILDGIYAQLRSSYQADYKTLLNNIAFTDLVYAQIMRDNFAGPLPHLAEYRTAVFNGETFPDCFETTARNLMNTWLYHSKTRTLLMPNLSTTPTATTGYYQKHADATLVEDARSHQDWVPLTTNRHNIAYYKVQDAKTKAVAIRPSNIEGFIKLSFKLDEDKIVGVRNVGFSNGRTQQFPIAQINERNYLLLADDGAFGLFEMQPSLRNTIVLLNDLSGINVIDRDSFKEEFVDNAEFNTTYFPLVAEKFGWSYDPDEAGDLDLDVDKRDIYFTLSVKGKNGEIGEFDLSLTRQHGYVRASSMMDLSADERDFRARLRNTLVAETNTREQRIAIAHAPLISLGTLLPYAGELRMQHPMKYHLTLMNKIMGNQAKIDLLKNILAHYRGAFHRERTLQLAQKLVQSLPIMPDFAYQVYAIDSIYAGRASNEPLLQKTTEDLCTTVISGIASWPENWRRSLQKIVGDTLGKCILMGHFDKMMTKKTRQVLEEVLEKELEQIVLVEVSKVEDELMLFRALWNTPSGVAYSKKLIKALLEKDKRAGLIILRSMVMRGEMLEEGALYAKNNSDGKYTFSRHWALHLFRSLIAQGREFEAALATAKKIATTETSTLRDTAIDLLGDLVHKGVGHEESRAIAHTIANKGNVFLRKKAFELYTALALNGYAMDEALQTLKGSLLGGFYSERYQPDAENAYKQLVILLNAGVGNKEVLSWAAIGDDTSFKIAVLTAAVEGGFVKDNDVMLKLAKKARKLGYEWAALKFYMVLINEGIVKAEDIFDNKSQEIEEFLLFLVERGMPAAIKYAIKKGHDLGKSEHESSRKAGLRFLIPLVKFNHDTETALEIAATTKDMAMKEELYEVLASVGIFHHEMTYVAQDALASTDAERRMRGLKIYMALMAHGRNLDDAKDYIDWAQKSIDRNEQELGVRAKALLEEKQRQ